MILLSEKDSPTLQILTALRVNSVGKHYGLLVLARTRTNSEASLEEVDPFKFRMVLDRRFVQSRLLRRSRYTVTPTS